MDYILKDEEECKRLGILFIPNPPKEYGEWPYQGLEPDEEWRNNVMIARMLIRENLSIFSMATVRLLELWENKYQDLELVDLPDINVEN